MEGRNGYVIMETMFIGKMDSAHGRDGLPGLPE
jgi:hypothetical protein